MIQRVCFWKGGWPRCGLMRIEVATIAAGYGIRSSPMTTREAARPPALIVGARTGSFATVDLHHHPGRDTLRTCGAWTFRFKSTNAGKHKEDEVVSIKAKDSAPKSEAASLGVVASSIRALRRRKGLTLADVAARTGIDKGYLSRIERGEKSPSLGTLLKVAEALSVQVGHLFGETTAPEAITLVRSGTQLNMAGDGAPMMQALLPASGYRRVSAFMLEPGTERQSRQTEHPGEEMLHVLEGSVEVIFADRVIQLDPGDTLHFEGHLRHQLRKIGRKRPRVLVIVAQDLSGRSVE